MQYLLWPPRLQWIFWHFRSQYIVRLHVHALVAPGFPHWTLEHVSAIESTVFFFSLAATGGVLSTASVALPVLSTSDGFLFFLFFLFFFLLLFLLRPVCFSRIWSISGRLNCSPAGSPATI